MHTINRSEASAPSLRHSIGVTIGAAIPALLYLLYVSRYSVNVPNGDDWYIIPVVNSALHGHLTMSELWTQYGDRRLFIGRLIFVAFGFIDHLDEKSIILFSAVLFIASYALLLLLLRAYLGRPLTPACFILGVVWFSLADVQNALWSFQLSWYLTVFCFVLMLYLLLVPRRRRILCLSLGMVVAVVASFSDIQGFNVWPVGLICILWARPWVRRTYYELVIWISAAVVTVTIYLPGYEPLYSRCRTPTCSFSYGLQHPDQFAKFFGLLVGNVVPTSLYDVHPRYVGAHELLGAIILAWACFVVVQSIRERRVQSSPLPVVLIAFAVLFDLYIALGRVGQGLLGAVNNTDHYTMPNIIMVVGIVIYAWAHTPSLHNLYGPVGLRGWLRSAGLVMLIAYVLAQTILTTNFGITNGIATRQERETAARVVVNLDQIPSAQRACYFGGLLVNIIDPWRVMAIRDHLSVFQPQAEILYRAQGPPVFSQCE